MHANVVENEEGNSFFLLTTSGAVVEDPGVDVDVVVGTGAIVVVVGVVPALLLVGVVTAVVVVVVVVVLFNNCSISSRAFCRSSFRFDFCTANTIVDTVKAVRAKPKPIATTLAVINIFSLLSITLLTVLSKIFNQPSYTAR